MPHRCGTLVNHVSHCQPLSTTSGGRRLGGTRLPRALLLARLCPGHGAGSQQGARAWPCHSMWRCSDGAQDQADVQAALPFCLENTVEKRSRFRVHLRGPDEQGR